MNFFSKPIQFGKLLIVKSLIIVGFLCLNSCQEETPEAESAIVPEYSKIKPKEDNETLRLLYDLIPVESASGSGRSVQTALGDIYLEEAIMAENLVDGITRYTFRFDGIKNEFSNLVIKVLPDGEVNGYIMTYYPDDSWFGSYKSESDYLNFSGDIVFSTLQGWDRFWIDFNNGNGNIYTIEGSSSSSGRVECDGDSDGSNGPGGGSASGYEVTGGGGPAGFGQFDWGSETIITIQLVFPSDNGDGAGSGPQVIARNECDTEPNPEGDCIDDDCGTPIAVYTPNLDICSINSCLSEACPNYEPETCEECLIEDENGDCILQNNSPLKDILRCAEMTKEQLDQLETVVSEYLNAFYNETCFNVQIYDIMKQNDRKLCFKMGGAVDAPGGYSKSEETIYFQDFESINEVTFNEEFFHAYQHLFYGDLPNDIGRSNIEFEAKLFHDLFHAACCIAIWGNEYEEEYKDWIRDLTNWNTSSPDWSALSEKYYYWVEIFRQTKPSYDYPIDYDLKPDAFLNLTDCTQ